MKKKTSPKKSTPPEMSDRLKMELATSELIKPQEELYTSMFHAVNPGDLMAAMGAMKKYHDSTGRRIKVLQSISTIAAYYPGAQHPTLNEIGQNVCVNLPMWTMLKPLVESQKYIHSFDKYEGQKIDIDLNVIRGKTNVNLPHGSIQGWVPLAWPDLDFDISKPWITLDGECPEHIKKQVSGKIILNFTERYRNPHIDYFFLKNYAPDLIFAGTEKEHWLFCNQWHLTIPRLEVNDFLDLAYAIKESRFILGNQSFCLNIAYSMDTPRITEICSFAQNVIHMIGPHSHGFLYQAGVEYYFRKLYDKTFGK